MKNRVKTGTMRLVLDRYGLSMPLSPETRERMSDDYRNIYDKIMKKTPGVTVFTAVTAWMFFLLKKTGIPVSIAKFATAAVLAVSIGAGIYVSRNKPVPLTAPDVPEVKYTVMIRPFSSRSLDQKAGIACAEFLRQSLDDKYGKGYSRISSGTGMGDSQWTVFGTVETVKDSTVMIMKVIDAQTSRTVFMAEEKCGAPDQCGSAAARMAEKFTLFKRR